ncbi:Uncharacterised protein [Chryseobacterium carnipullorum]|uniref:Uncharacterized protein n=1 Tax=Chryseobacterium carnipullorum TaxID=1124835 RepID=A0A376EQJ7_CHRCU|nr:Uncharacterised protein [Chryseobacterium carnipullorum]
MILLVIISAKYIYKLIEPEVARIPIDDTEK